MAHAHHHDAAGHASAEDEYRVTPPGAGYEHTDASVWIIVKFGIWLAVSAVIIHVGLGVLFGLFVKQREEATHEFPLAGQEHRLPAAPRLQQFPENEFVDFRQREESILRNYGWVNKEAGVVRIPIEDAMRLTVERGLPTRGAPPEPAPPDQAQPTTAPAPQAPGLMPADSSAGRTLERRRQ